jgi:serine/threonine protein kinase
MSHSENGGSRSVTPSLLSPNARGCRSWPTACFRLGMTDCDDTAPLPILGGGSSGRGAFRPHAPLPGRLTPPCPFGHYELLSRLGSGHYGMVFKARCLQTSRTVALKLLTPDGTADEETKGRFRREVEVLRTLSSDHLVHLLDAGQVDDHYYLAMDLVPGESLAHKLTMDGTYPLEATLRMGCHVARALATLHAHGLVHRDVKPANVMVRPDGVTVLVDLGLVRPLQSADGVTADGVILGTPYYLSPEVVRGDEPNPKSDVYALGVTLWQALVGRPPINAPSVFRVMERIAASEPLPDVRDECPDLPLRISRVLAGVTAPEPDERFSAADLARTLELLLEGLVAERTAMERVG